MDGNFIAKFNYGDHAQSISVSKEAFLKYGAGLAAGVSLGLWTFQKFTDTQERKRLRGLVQQKLADRENQLVSLRSMYKMNQELKEIVELPLEQLIHKLQTRELTAKKVLEATMTRSVEVTEEFNCITEFHPRAMVSTAHSMNSYLEAILN